MEPHLYRKLTPKELECVRLVARNRTSKQIGRELGRSEHTVDNQIKSALAKTGLSSRYDLAALVAEHEGRSQPLASPPPVMAAPPAPPQFRAAAGEGVREERASFLHEPRIPAAPPATGGERARPYERLVLILLGGVLFLAALHYLPDLASVAQAVGDLIRPRKH